MNLKDTARALFHGVLSPRQGVRVFGVGAAKTGTHSFAQMYADRVRSAHEQDCEHLIRLHLDAEKSGDRSELKTFLRRKDRVQSLKINASQVNIYLLDDVLEIWPDSRFVLTIRPPMSWLRSIIDDSLRRDVSDVWMRFRDYRFSTVDPLPEEEKALKDKGLHPLSGYLSYWADSIATVTHKVPADQLLVVKAETLYERSAEIAEFCGVPGGAVSKERSHAFANTTRFGVLADVPEHYLFAVAEKTCGPLMATHFPERDLKQDVSDIRAA